MTDRVQKILAQWGIASRRNAEKMILAGRVTLNGNPVQLGDQADPREDQICVDGKPLKSEQHPEKHYYIINKPRGFVSTCSDPRDRRTVLELLPPELHQGHGMHPVGRLDAQSTGALILTNDGDFTLSLTHPRFHIRKTYRVWLQGRISEKALRQWRLGVMLGDRLTLPAEITLKKVNQDKTCVDIMLTEGRNRQIRRVAEQLGYPVISLHRSAIGSVRIDDLPRGGARPLTELELNELRQSIHPITSFIKSPASVREYSV
jgi:pseudouridine synthase